MATSRRLQPGEETKGLWPSPSKHNINPDELAAKIAQAHANQDHGERKSWLTAQAGMDAPLLDEPRPARRFVDPLPDGGLSAEVVAQAAREANPERYASQERRYQNFLETKQFEARHEAETQAQEDPFYSGDDEDEPRFSEAPLDPVPHAPVGGSESDEGGTDNFGLDPADISDAPSWDPSTGTWQTAESYDAAESYRAQQEILQQQAGQQDTNQQAAHAQQQAQADAAGPDPAAEWGQAP